MRAVGVVPALSIVAGSACAAMSPAAVRPFIWLLPIALAVGIVGWRRKLPRVTIAGLVGGFWASGVVLGVHAAERARHPRLRAVLEREVGGFDISTIGPGRDHEPILTRAELLEDASPRDGFVTLRLQVSALRIGGAWHPVDGGVIASVGGAAPRERVLEWRAGRSIEAPIVFRRPARFLNDGVADFEEELARDGFTLLGSIKSALLVEVTAHAGPIDELAARLRVHVRSAISVWIAPHSDVSAAIATAVLIGDRTGLPDETRDALQAAGTYHVIAISGGNIAIVAAAACGLLALVGIRGRIGALLTILVLIAYAAIVTAGPSVWRATTMAVAYFTARTLDHRMPVWQAIAVAAAGILVVRPLDVADPGFLLTFGATAALVGSVRRGASLRRAAGGGVMSWVVATVIGSLAVEAVLLPVSALEFSRVTAAGLLLNLVAIPAMGAVQIASTIVTVADASPLAYTAGWAAHAAAAALVASADLVTMAPWLAARVPPPAVWLVLVYYGALAGAIAGRGPVRAASVMVFVASLAAVVSGVDPVTLVRSDGRSSALRLTVFDVGQGESMLIEAPGYTLLVDSGGGAFGGGGDIGRRVLAPALWSRRVRRLDALLVTHGDPDHLGGAADVIDDFRPRRIYEGIRLPQHEPTRELIQAAGRRRIPVTPLRSGDLVPVRGVKVRVLHPPPPDWERRRVRNDDSVVLEILRGDVAILLTGDISAAIERAILPQLTPARIRILKVAHHGSRTSSSRELLETWRPQVAIVSSGRGNRFGHPAREVLERLEAIGATVLRTDFDGQITIETDGRALEVETYITKGTKGGRGVSVDFLRRFVSALVSLSWVPLSWFPPSPSATPPPSPPGSTRSVAFRARRMHPPSPRSGG